MEYLKDIRHGKKLNTRHAISLIISLSLPVMMAQVSLIVMQYVDASMVGHMDTKASASIGLMATTTWLLSGVLLAFAAGFNVQVAHRIGANDERGARDVVKYGLMTNTAIGVALMTIALLISGSLPIWLGGAEEILKDASSYLVIYAIFLPTLAINYTAGGMLQSSGNVRVPSMLNIIMCFLDVIYNFFFIFPTRQVFLFENSVTMPGLGMGAAGAALGTGLAQLSISVFMLIALLKQSESLSLRKNEKTLLKYKDVLNKCLKISLPYGLENVALSSAQVMTTKIVAPLGTMTLAAHSFALTAESLCFYPGYGAGEAATTVIGQSIGAKREDLAISLAWISTGFGILLMVLMGSLLYIFAPLVISFLTPVKEVIEVSVGVLRIEALVEPMFGAAISISGVFRGYGKTLLTGLMNVFSIWFIRIPLSLVLVKSHGIKGVWIAMAVELFIRGAMFIIRLIVKTIRTQRKELRNGKNSRSR